MSIGRIDPSEATIGSKKIHANAKLMTSQGQAKIKRRPSLGQTKAKPAHASIPRPGRTEAGVQGPRARGLIVTRPMPKQGQGQFLGQTKVKGRARAKARVRTRARAMSLSLSSNINILLTFTMSVLSIINTCK